MRYQITSPLPKSSREGEEGKKNPLPSKKKIVVSFYWGSVVLISVNVKKFPDPEQAKTVSREKLLGFVDLVEDKNPAGPIVIAGFPTRASSWAYSMFYFNIKNFDPL